MWPQHHIHLAFATQRAVRAEHFVTGVDDLPAQLGEELERRLFDQLVFIVGEVGHQQAFRWIDVFWVVLFRDESMFVTV